MSSSHIGPSRGCSMFIGDFQTAYSGIIPLGEGNINGSQSSLDCNIIMVITVNSLSIDLPCDPGLRSSLDGYSVVDSVASTDNCV